MEHQKVNLMNKGPQYRDPSSSIPPHAQQQQFITGATLSYTPPPHQPITGETLPPGPQSFAQAWVALTNLYEPQLNGFGSPYTILHEYTGLSLTLYTLDGKLIKCKEG